MAALRRSQITGGSARRARVPPDKARLLPRHRRRVATGACSFAHAPSPPPRPHHPCALLHTALHRALPARLYRALDAALGRRRVPMLPDSEGRRRAPHPRAHAQTSVLHRGRRQRCVDDPSCRRRCVLSLRPPAETRPVFAFAAPPRGAADGFDAPARRRRHRRQGRPPGVARGRLLGQPVQLPDQAPRVARPQLVQAQRETRPVCHPPRTHHLGHSGCVPARRLSLSLSRVRFSVPAERMDESADASPFGAAVFSAVFYLCGTRLSRPDPG